MTGTLAAAQDALRRGRQPIPVPKGQKAPRLPGWQDLRLAERELPARFGADANLGVLNGSPSGNQVDVDLDCAEALRLADRFLPATQSVFGRPSKPRSHRLYAADPLPATTQFRDVDGAMLLEARSTGTQTLFPPSTHPSGERIAWDEDGDPTRVDGQQLMAAVAKTAAACLLAGHYPAAGGRHDAALALAGALLRSGWREDWVRAFIEAVAAAADDDEAGERAAAAAYTARRLADGHTATGWNRLAQYVGPDVVRRLRDFLGAGHSEDSEHSEAAWERPVPLADFPRPPFPADVLPGWLRAYVEAVAGATQTPPALAGMLALSALAAACAKTVLVQLAPDWREPVNLFTATAMAPGERKSAVFAEVARPLADFEAAETARIAPLVAEAMGRRKIAEQALAKAQKDAAVAPPNEQAALLSAADRMARELAATEVPTLPRLVVDDCSPERLASLLAEQGGRLAVMAAEGDVFDLMAGRYSATGAPNFGVYLRGHAGDELRVDRVGRLPEFVPAPALTVGLAIQPAVVHGLAALPGFRGRGLLGRFLYAMPDSLVGRRAVDPPPLPEDVRRSYHQNQKTLLAMAPSTPDDPGDQPAPHRLVLAPAAAARFRAFQAALEPRLGDLGDLGHVRDWAGKLAGAVARIAGLLHVAEHVAEGQPWARPISDGTMAGAVRLGEDFLIPHALAAFSEMGADPAVADARYVLRVIAARDLEGFTKRDLFQHVKGRLKTTEPLDRALTVLVEHGYVRMLAERSRAGPGRKASPAFVVNPLWLAGPAPDSQDQGAEDDVDAGPPAGAGLAASQNPQYSHNGRRWVGPFHFENFEHCEQASDQQEIVEWAATL